MAWREASIVEQRREFVVLASVKGANVALLCRRFGISRETGHKWIERFKAGGAVSLADRSRRPPTSPEKTADAAEAAVLGLRDAHRPGAGAAADARSARRARGQHDHRDPASPRSAGPFRVGEAHAAAALRA